EYHWLGGQYDRLPGLMADLVRRHVTVIATGSVPAALAAKAATTTIPIVFGVAEDPVRLGLVDNIARPSGNATGINWFVQEVAAKRLGLLHDLVPKAVLFAVLINPANASSAESTLRDVKEQPLLRSGCKSRYSTRRQLPRSIRHSPTWHASAPMPSSSLPMHSLAVAACSLPR